MKKFLKIFFLIIILGAGGFWVYIKFISPVVMKKSMTMVPDDAVLVIETENLADAWTEISNSKVWNYLLKNPYFNDLNEDFDMLNKYLNNNNYADFMLKKRSMIMSLHMISARDWDFLFVVDLQNLAQIKKIGLKNLPRPLRLFILVSSVFALANFSYMFFVLRAQEFFTGRLSVGIPIFLYTLFNIFYAMFAIPFGKLSDKIGRKKVIIFGYLLFSLTSLGFAFFNSLTSFMVLFAFYGIVYAMIDGNQRAYVSDLSSEELRGTALGTFHTAMGLAALPASLIAGFLWQINPSITFIYGATISIISVILFIVFRNYFKE